MVCQRKMKYFPLLGIFLFLLILFYLFSIIAKSKSFVELRGSGDESYNENPNSLEPEKLLLTNLRNSNYSKQISRNPMGVMIRNKKLNYKYRNRGKNEPGFIKSLTEKFFGASLFNHRIVHLDLKGAPPKMDYIITILPLLKTLGATGILIEYEDMFPYTDELEALSAHNAYKQSEIQSLQEAAKKNEMEIIPLVQTFGHMEFVLKLKEFANLREVASYPQAICPLRNGSFPLIMRMLDQVLTLHPDINWIHIGSDEVYNIGECHICQEYTIRNRLSNDDLFLQHAFKIAHGIKSKYDVQPIMWDDEFRKIPLHLILKSKIKDYVEIMVWKYNSGILARLGNSIWDKYSQAFDGVWVASAFKGAALPDSFLTDINERLRNNMEWVEVAELYKSSVNFRGIALTGWQRFDHFAVLCELLPQGIPSLAVSLTYINNKKADHEALSSVGDILGCNSLINLDLKYLEFLNTCHFPGAKVYEISQRLFMLKKEVNAMIEGAHRRGWVTQYNIDNNFASPQQVEIGLQDLSMLLFEFKKMYTDAKNALQEVYDEHTVKEWISINLDPHSQKLNSLYQARNELLTATSWPRRPIDSSSNKEL